MDILHPGNWPLIGRVLTEVMGRRIDLYECPLCFALTREPIDHGQFHVRQHGAHTTRAAAS